MGWEMSVVALGEPYFVTSLRAAGVESRVVGSVEEAESAVEMLVGEGKCKVIVISEGLALKLERKRDELARRGVYYPVFAVVPEMGKRVQERTHRLSQLISQAVGARLKLGEE
jgi:vacuolar-type H+-ATPase subunit F/Vma7